MLCSPGPAEAEPAPRLGLASGGGGAGPEALLGVPCCCWRRSCRSGLVGSESSLGSAGLSAVDASGGQAGRRGVALPPAPRAPPHLAQLRAPSGRARVGRAASSGERPPAAGPGARRGAAGAAPGSGPGTLRARARARAAAPAPLAAALSDPHPPARALSLMGRRAQSRQPALGFLLGWPPPLAASPSPAGGRGGARGCQRSLSPVPLFRAQNSPSAQASCRRRAHLGTGRAGRRGRGASGAACGAAGAP